MFFHKLKKKRIIMVSWLRRRNTREVGIFFFSFCKFQENQIELRCVYQSCKLRREFESWVEMHTHTHTERMDLVLVELEDEGALS